MRLRPLAAALLFGGSTTLALAADCSRQDIDHYLDRGFTPQQVLELCRPAETADSTGADGVESDAAYWRDVIDASAVQMDAQTLSFTRRQCIAFDRPNYAQQRKKACGKVHYRIGLQGLELLESHKKLLYWGRNSIAVSSPDTQRRFELNQDQLPLRDQEMLRRELPHGPRSEIPIRDGVAVGAVRERLQALLR